MCGRVNCGVLCVCVWVEGLIVVCCVCVGGRVNCGVLCVWVAGAWR